MLGERCFERAGQNRGAIAGALAFADGDLMPGRIEIFDAETKAFEQPKTGAVRQAADQGVVAVESGEEMARTSERERTTGSRRGARARTALSRPLSSRPSTSLYRKRIAERA